MERRSQKSSTENNEQANTLPLRELHVPHQVHRQYIDINIGNSISETVNKQCYFRGVACCAVWIPVCGHWVTLLLASFCQLSIQNHIFPTLKFIPVLEMQEGEGKRKKGTYEYNNTGKRHRPHSNEHNTAINDSSISSSGRETQVEQEDRQFGEGGREGEEELREKD